MYDVLVGGIEAAANITSGMQTTITVPASGSTVSITFRDATDNGCVSAVVLSGTLATCSPVPVAICTEIFVDRNNNGMRDSGEPALPGVVLQAFTTGVNMAVDNGGGDDMLAGTDTSDPGTGAVAINDLMPGEDYYLRMDMSGLPNLYLSFPLGSDWVQVPAGSRIFYSSVQTLTPAGSSNGCSPVSTGFRNPGFFEPVAVGDYTWVDLNADGQQAGEPILEGVQVTLYDVATNLPVTTDVDGNAVTPLETDTNGAYLFENLAPGSYYVVFDKDGGSVVNPEFYTLTTPDQGADASDSDAALATGRSANTPELESGEEDLTLDAGYTCTVAAEAGIGPTICSTATVDLTTLGASISPLGVAGFGATWTSSGTGTFDGGGVFGTATSYTPSAADVLAGQVILTLTTSDPAGFGSACSPASDDVLIVILKVGCGTFPWSGN